MPLTIRKADFVQLLDTIQQTYDRDAEFSHEAGKYFNCNFIAGNHDHLINLIVESLDHSACCCGFVSDWVFDMDFGRNNNVITFNDRDYSLPTAGDLFDFLIKIQNDTETK